MPSDSVSFRITRTAEDLAQTVTALSQRLVRLEQRLGALELQARVVEEVDPQELVHLDVVERLLNDCRTLLEATEPGAMEPAVPMQEVSGSLSEDGNPIQDQYHQAA